MKSRRKGKAIMLAAVLFLSMLAQSGMPVVKAAGKDTTEEIQAESGTDILKKTTELVNVRKKNASDVKILRKIIKQQKALGADMPMDLNDVWRYRWNDSGRLIWLNWNHCDLKGRVSLKGLSALEEFYCNGKQLRKLDVSKNKKLKKKNLICDGDVEVKWK
ncbi:MAG: hypothetical protein NC300_11905 [Bacteroidales bacterium]|nr:hypothetical protein [Clostridium sp.]MCM1204836.1 hypothetical protein [Bacteroidales bacterium]